MNIKTNYDQVAKKFDSICNHWLDENGKEINLTPEMTKTWKPDVWDAYIEYLDKKETRMRETLMTHGDLDKMSQSVFQEKLRDFISMRDRKRISETIDIALDGLSEMQRNVLILRYVESWTLKKIANHLDISTRTVRTHQSRAEEAIKENLTMVTTKRGSLNKLVKKKYFQTVMNGGIRG